MPRLIVRRSGENSRVLELVGDRPFSIGRAKSCNLVLDDESVSRLHAVVRSTMDGHWQIIDRGSVNGVKINGIAAKETTLRPNAKIAIGVYELTFEEPDARGFTPFDTHSLPKSVVREMQRSPYSGSLLPVEPVGSLESPDVRGKAEMAERIRALEKENALLTLLYRAARALGELNEIDAVTERVLDLALEIEGVERGYVMLLDDPAGADGKHQNSEYTFRPATIRYRREPLDSKKRVPNLIMSRGVIDQVMRSFLPLLVADAKADSRFAARKSIALSEVHSAMCSPLGAQDRRLGLLYVDNSSRGLTFSIEDLNVFSVIASQAGWAIERIRSRQMEA